MAFLHSAQVRFCALRGHPPTSITWKNRLTGVAALFVVGCGTVSKQRPSVKVEAPLPALVAPIAVAAVPLRRLTNEEYNNTVRDLLGDTTRPASSFPPDEVVGGFENNTIAPVTQLLIERYMSAAETLATTATTTVERLEKLAPCAAGEAHELCARKLIDTFGRRAYRRPLDDEERSTLLALYTEKEKRSDHAKATQLVVEAILLSPKFLYRLEPLDERNAKMRPLTGYEVATRLSYFIWASTPDNELLDAASSGRLTAPDDIGKAARRLLKDRRAGDGIRSFHRQWLDLRKLETDSKDSALYPGFTRDLKDAMVEETLRFGAHTVLDGGDAFATLLTSKKSYINAPLAKLYGVSPPAAGGFSLVELPNQERSGLLTHASVMSVHANAEQSSPILRGKFVREKLLCQTIPPPPPNVANSPPKFDPKLTKKEQFALHQTDPSCAGCHRMMDPIGFGFEHYDAIGAWRTVDGAFSVDAVGELSGSDNSDGAFDGAVALGARLSSSQVARHCFATQWFRSALGGVESDDDAPSLEAAYQSFSHAGFDVRELIVAITTSDAFRYAGFETETTP